ncbi:hypothetical protein [Chryseobacterium sp. Mn2064]|uniref:hypothetical protein n=1 Tax=Chryseobacterium sp. Mn2064 TaxID=3395263 RepID=UPI003BC81D71
MKRLMVILAALITGTILFFLFREEEGNNNIILLIFLQIFSIPLAQAIFPQTKKLGIGTSDFYPNIWRKLRNK